MNKAKKILALVCCAALLVCISVGATLAYLTFQTEVVKNTFTVGKVKIDLDEALVNEEGDPIEEDLVNNEEEVKVEREEAPRVKTNDYKLMPGHTYTKDPTVTLKAGSEPSYVRMRVTINEIANLKAACGIAEGELFLPENFVNNTWNSSIWESASYEVVGDTVVCEFWYHEIVSTEDMTENDEDETKDFVLPPLFTEIHIPGTATNDQIEALENLQIDIIADAIQADGFDSPELAWETFDGLSDAEIDTEK